MNTYARTFSSTWNAINLAYLRHQLRKVTIQA
jgi:hypothetical protein